jgi:hypothetical protein
LNNCLWEGHLNCLEDTFVAVCGNALNLNAQRDEVT